MIHLLKKKRKNITMKSIIIKKKPKRKNIKKKLSTKSISHIQKIIIMINLTSHIRMKSEVLMLTLKKQLIIPHSSFEKNYHEYT
jgi:hypothetical protein